MGMYYDEPSLKRRLCRWGLLLVGVGMAVTGMALPWPSYLEKKSLREDYVHKTAEFEQRRRAIMDRYGASALGRPEPARQMNEVMLAENKYILAIQPVVNAAIERHSRLWKISLVLLVSGLAIAVAGWYATARREATWQPQDLRQMSGRIGERLRE